MKSIILKRGQLMWLALYYADGSPDPEVMDLFGLNEAQAYKRLLKYRHSL